MADVTAVILAGGRASRMGGGDKVLLMLAGRPLLAHAIERLRPQVAALALSANGDPARFAAFALPVLADPLPDQPGPLAGVLAGLRWAAARPGGGWLLSLPGDTPLPPPDLVARLLAAAAPGSVAVAASRGQVHPAVALWPLSVADRLAAALHGGERRVRRFADACGMTVVDFAAVQDRDPFLNINTPEDLRAAQAMLAD